MHGLQTHAFVDPGSGLSLPYRLFVPKTVNADGKCGLLVFLHGAGERGSDNQGQLANCALSWIEAREQRRFPTVVVYPQCPLGMQWVDSPWTKPTYRVAQVPISQPLQAVLHLLDSLVGELPVDEARLLVTGLSMGGYGTWDIITRQPHRFAAAMPLCGGGDPSQAPLMREIPIWAFHGDRDPAVSVEGSREMVKALRAAGAAVQYTEYLGAGHDIWTRTYYNNEALLWLLSSRRP